MPLWLILMCRFTPAERSLPQLDTLITDGAYPSETNDQELRTHKVQITQTGIRGKRSYIFFRASPSLTS